MVVDPQWEVDAYRRLARLHGVRIGHILETHNHADHVSGHGRLVRQTGATIHVHELAEAEYAHEPFADGWKLTIGDLTVEAIHTPGHRPEHTCFLLSDATRGGAPWALLSGDSLFIGDVARPDLAIEPREGAAQMFHSLHERLLALDDEVEVWPGHLGGSLCGGAGIDLKSSSTIGFERAHNPALAIAAEAEFVASATSSLPDRPPNVEQIVALNRGPLIEGFGAPLPMTPHEVEEAVAAGAVVIDGRTNEEFDEAHIAGALSTSAYDTGFATKVSRVAPPGVEIIVVAANDVDECEAAELLAAVGLRVRGFLEGGMTAWRTDGRPVERIELIDPDELARRVDGTERAGGPRRPQRHRVRRRAHPRQPPHPLRRHRRPGRRAAPRPPDRGDLPRRQTLRPRRLDPPARRLRRRDPRRQGRRRLARRRQPGRVRARPGPQRGLTD